VTAGPRWQAADRYETVIYGEPEDVATLAGAARAVIDLWAERTAAIGARAEVGYVLVTDDAAAGHGQIWAFAAVPPAPLAELHAVPCSICGEHPGDRLVTEAMGWRVWASDHASWPYAAVIAPVGHRPDLASLATWERDALAQLLADVLGRFARLDLAHFLWVHQQPADGRPWPNAHVHIEVAAAPTPPSAAELGAGVFFNPVPPAEAAAALRGAGGAGPPPGPVTP